MPDSPGVPLQRPPSPSRIRDALLGGRRNLHADRDLADRLELRFPGTAQAAAEARAFTGRAVTWCAQQGIAQYIVPEPGLPLPGGAADAARAVIPGARVAYACTDPSEAAYARAEAARDDATAAVRGIGAGSPACLLTDPALRAVIDLGEPAAAVLAMIAHLMPGRQAARMVAAFAARLGRGHVGLGAAPRGSGGKAHRRVPAAPYLPARRGGHRNVAGRSGPGCREAGRHRRARLARGDTGAEAAAPPNRDDRRGGRPRPLRPLTRSPGASL